MRLPRSRVDSHPPARPRPQTSGADCAGDPSPPHSWTKALHTGRGQEVHDGDMALEGTQIGEFLAAHGGPFYELQRRLGLLHEHALRAGPRAAIFVGLAWGVPLVLSLIEGHAFGQMAEKPYLLELGAWARFLIAVGVFVLAEWHVERQLKG